MNCCETCVYFAYDEEYEEYFCSADMDEDEMYRLLNDNRDGCKYYRCGDEYKVVRKQN